MRSRSRKDVKQREELSQRHKSFLGKREELSRHMADLDKEIFRLESRKEGYEEASEKQINYMWEEYEITYSHALELRDKESHRPGRHAPADSDS